LLQECDTYDVHIKDPATEPLLEDSDSGRNQTIIVEEKVYQGGICV
jgi:hypothetical protein